MHVGSRLAAACLVVVSVALATPAAAQSEDEQAGIFAATAAAFGISPLTSATSTIGTTVGGGVTLLIVLVNEASDDSSWRLEYIRKNAIALQHDLTVGGGESIDDLAVALRVDRADRGAFARMLHERRRELVPLTDLKRLDAERADRFFRTLLRGMESHPTLRDDLRQLAWASPARK